MKQLEIDYGIEWHEYKVGELFEIKPTKNYGLSNNELLRTNGQTPVVSNTSLNNGIKGYVKLEPTEKGNIITFSDTTTDSAIFYQPNDFVGYSHIQGMYKKFDEDIGENQYLFIVSAFKRAVKGKYNYGSKFNRENAAKELICLPTINSADGKVLAFEFMDAFIRRLKHERVEILKIKRNETLNAYLSVSDLKEYTLTDEEDAALADINEREWRETGISKIFEKLKLQRRKKKFNKLKDTATSPTGEFNLPLVNAKKGSNGIMFYGRERDFDSAEMTIDVVSNGAVATGCVYAQPQKTGVLWDAYLLKPKIHHTTKENLLFLAASLQKSIRTKFSWEDKAVWSKVKDGAIMIPVKSDGSPDYDYMNLLISAVKKKVIGDMIFKADEAIEATLGLVVSN